MLCASNPESSMSLDLPTVKTVYRQAIDARARDAEGDSWWMEVAAEVQSVVDTFDAREAAAIINWWHDDWSAIGDTPARAARRIRTAAKRVCGQH